MVKREGVTSWVGGYVEGGTLGGGGFVGCWIRWGGTLVGGFVGCWIRWGGTLGGGSTLAEKRNVESGTSTREDRSKTAQKPLKSCLKNRSKIIARKERFLSGFLSKIWAVWAVFPKKNAQTAQTAQFLLENRSNRSNLERFLSGISTRVITASGTKSTSPKYMQRDKR